MKKSSNTLVHKFGKGKGQKFNKKTKISKKRGIRHSSKYWYVPKALVSSLKQSHCACSTCVNSFKNPKFQALFPNQLVDSSEFFLFANYVFCLAQEAINSCEKFDFNLIEQVLNSN